MNSGMLDAPNIYKVALDTRNFEITLFWQRSNYFLSLNTVLAIGFFNLHDNKKYSLTLAVLGTVVSILWYLANLGSKFWQSRWENRLRIVEEQVAPELKFFAADWATIRNDVQESLKNGSHRGLQKLLYNQVSKKPSVSYLMILLSLVFVAAWVLLIAMTIFA
jgi:hypothetical protein